MRYMLRVAYDGTEYCGWQMQPGLRTVEGTLKSALNQAYGHRGTHDRCKPHRCRSSCRGECGGI